MVPRVFINNKKNKIEYSCIHVLIDQHLINYHLEGDNILIYIYNIIYLYQVYILFLHFYIMHNLSYYVCMML
jgi:hypothetical protein